jgi:hypothetical protein
VRNREGNRERLKQVSSVFLCGKDFGTFRPRANVMLRSAFLNKMCDLQTFTNFFFPATIFKEQYHLLAETSLKSRCWTLSNASNVPRRPHSDLITPRSSYA